ncbi:hypothetical protein EON65_32720 [archaeon]|nr:MAG: hypothetical protein EON65_32720 [archaeon]
MKTHNLVAFYDNTDKAGKNFDKKYGGRTIQLTKVYGGKTYVFNATIADTCGNDNCDNRVQ